MTSWSAKRRFEYFGAFLIVSAVLAGLVFWKVIYKTPTCTDGIKNGGEKGIDCGGACQKLCTSDALKPVVLWSKIFNISGDVYTAVAYVENPNINSKNPQATYEFKVYDANNKLITVVSGKTSIPKNKKFAVFETGIISKNSKPKSVDFEFKTFASWEKDTVPEPQLNLTYSSLLRATTSPRVTGTIQNNSNKSLSQIELAVLVLDGNENVVAAGRSFVDNLLQKTSQDFVFTWPKPFNLGVEACISPVDVVLALDRSGSMKSESVSPPEPFNTVKTTAEQFVSNLKNDDHISIISFGDDARVESSLNKSKEKAVSAVKNLQLSTSTSENTNIVSALVEAENQLTGGNMRVDSKKVIILLTDGIPNLPKDSTISDYPITGAQNIASNLKTENIIIYTIGLGKNINESFLKRLSSIDESYFPAPSKDTLNAIYSKISQDLCTKRPNVVTVIYRSL